jgi:hypothetical protein
MKTFCDVFCSIPVVIQTIQQKLSIKEKLIDMIQKIWEISEKRTISASIS